MFPTTCLDASRRLLDSCRARGIRIATAESCTGGLVAGCLTEHAGSSDAVDRGWVVYDNAAKEALLGVRRASLESEGAVSERVAREMAEGALERSGCGLALAVTGIAGPGGGSEAKPVGLVHMAAAVPGLTLHLRRVFPGDRSAVRLATVETTLLLGLRALEERPATA